MVNASRQKRLLPPWLNVLVMVLPGLTSAACATLMGLTNHLTLFNLTPRDSYLVAGIGSLLLGLVVAQAILCLAQAHALKVLSRKS